MVPLLGPLATHASASDAPSAGNVTEEFRVERHRLEALIEANPADTTAQLKLAHLLHDAHLEAEAVPHYRDYTRQHPNNRQAWLDLATVEASGANWAGAQSATEALLHNFPNDPAGLYNLGAIFANTGKVSDAEEIWRRVADQTDDPGLAAKAVVSINRLSTFTR